MTPTRRGYGRRRSDRFKIAVGLFLGLVLAVVTLSTSRCDTAQPTSVDREVPVAASTPAPTPSPTATPAVVAEPDEGLTATFVNGPVMTITNTHPIPMSVGYCNFRVYDGGEQQLHESALDVVVGKGGSYSPKLTKLECQQVDAIFGGSTCQNFTTIIGAAYFKNGVRVPSNQLTGCNPTCVEKWEAIDEATFGEWGAWSACAAAQTEGCERTRTRTVTYYEQNSCTKSKRVLRTATETQTEACECACVEQGIPGVKDYLTPVWSGTIEQGECVYGPPQLTPAAAAVLACHENGTQGWVENYTCQADITGTINVCRSAACPCVEQWVEQPPIITTSEWSTCVLGTQTRTVRTLINEVNSCNQQTRVKSDTTITQTQDCQTPGHCYYKISGGNEVYKQAHCEAAPGFPLFGGGGSWINFQGSKLDNHCDIPFPGISQIDFQLTPGQSAPGCLDKH